jgi:hypothetical protein
VRLVAISFAIFRGKSRFGKIKILFFYKLTVKQIWLTRFGEFARFVPQKKQRKCGLSATVHAADRS